MAAETVNLRCEPGEKRISVYFRKQDGPESKEGTTGVVLRIKGGAKAVTAYVDAVNKTVLSGEEGGA